MSTLLSYTHHFNGPTGILVDISAMPLEITVVEDLRCPVAAQLAGADANTVQLGPFGARNRDVRMRAMNKERRGRIAITSVLPGAIFSQTASAKGNTRVVQCGGDMTIGGHGVKDGARLEIPRGCWLELKSHGLISVNHFEEVLTVVEAVTRGLFELDGKGEAGFDRQ